MLSLQLLHPVVYVHQRFGEHVSTTLVSIRSCTKRERISFLENALRTTAPNFHDGSSFIQVR
jgi:hypothetical protein